MTLFPKRGVLVLAALACAFSAPPAGAELAKWDQTRVTEIAQQLAEACSAWHQALRQQPPDQIGSGSAGAEFGLAQAAQMLEEQSRALAGHLAAGKGHDETRNLYRSLKEQIDDTEEQAKRADLDEPALGAWARVADLMRQVAPYYDPKALDEQ